MVGSAERVRKLPATMPEARSEVVCRSVAVNVGRGMKSRVISGYSKLF